MQTSYREFIIKTRKCDKENAWAFRIYDEKGKLISSSFAILKTEKAALRAAEKVIAKF